jgi:hypothetical protein
MAVLAAVRQRDARRILKAIRSAMHDLGDHGKRANCARADAGRQQQIGKIDRTALGGGSERAMQTPAENVGRPDIMMGRHDEMRKHGLRRRSRSSRQRVQLAHDAVRSELAQKLELRRTRCAGAAVDEVDDLALLGSIDGAVRLLDEAREFFGVPVVAARRSCVAVHPLLHDRPLAVRSNEEAVQVEVEAVLHGGAVDFRHQPARVRELRTVKADALAEQLELLRRFPRMLTAAATDIDAELVLQRHQSALQCADNACRDAGRMPIHAHHGAEGLKPEGMRQPLQEFVAAVVMDHRLGHDGAQHGHARRQPGRHPSAMQG